MTMHADRYDIAARVRHFRTQAQISQADLAALVGCGRSTISMIEHGQRVERAERLSFLLPLCQALAVDLRTFLTLPLPEATGPDRDAVEALDAALSRPDRKGSYATVVIARDVAGRAPGDAVLVREPAGEYAIMDRRTAVRTGASMIIGLGGGIAASAAGPLDPEQSEAATAARATGTANQGAIDAFTEVLAVLRRAEDQLGSNPSLLTAAESHLAMLRGWLAAGQPASLVPQLGHLVAQFSQFAGWVAYDDGQLSRSLRLYGVGLETAQTLADPGLSAFMAADFARVEIERGNRNAVRRVECAVELASATESNALLSFANTRCGGVYGQAGPRQAANAVDVLSSALELIQENSPVRTPPYLYWFNAATIEVWHGLAHLRVGRHGTAQRLLGQAVDDTPERFPRCTAEHRHYLAQAYATVGDVTMAASVATAAAEQLAGVNSRRVTSRLRTLHRQLTGMENRPEVREFGAALAHLP